MRASGLQSRKIRNFLNNRIDMEKNEQTMRLSEDPRFIKHVKQILADYRRHYNLAVDNAEKRHVRLKEAPLRD